MRTSGSTLISLAIGNAMSDYHVANRLNHGLHQGTRGDFSVAEKKKTLSSMVCSIYVYCLDTGWALQSIAFSWFIND